MSKAPNRLWALWPIPIILLTAFAYYAKYHWAREWVDTRFPWVERNIGSRLPPLVITVTVPAEPAPPGNRPATGNAESRPVSQPTPAPRSSSFLPPDPPPSFVGPDGSIDLQKLAAEKAAWPKIVVIKKPTEFPAVVNGKVAGKLQVPAGTEANLVTLKDGQVGVEYRGGGAWVKPEDTDLIDRVKRSLP